MIKYFNRPSLLLLFVCAIASTSMADEGNPPHKTSNKLSVYPSAQQEGLIGVTEESPIDNPVDNIFHVVMKEQLCGEETVWLSYELEGVGDHTSVSRSINDQVAVGGYLVKRRRGWALQRERIHASWLKQGDNVVRFTLPENALHNYKVRNLKVEVEHIETSSDEIKIIFNQPSKNYFFDKAYVKGIVTGAGDKNIRINVKGREARMFNGEFEAVIDFESAEQSCIVEVEAIYPNGQTTCHQVEFSQPQSADFSYSIENYTYKKEQFFMGNESESILLNGATLSTVKGGLKNPATLSITTLRPIDIAPLDAGMENVTRYHAGYRFLPHGTIFNKEAHLRIPYDIEKIPDGYTEQDIRTYYFDEQSHHWVALNMDTVLTATSEVLSTTIHFTDMINAIIKVPESPEVEAYNSTSMKGIKAANPTAGVNLISPPQANNTGSASLGYPINIPAGRAGMQPQLSISYNSGGGNGWMGLGWNISLPMISIDTRWGVPRYDSLKETETYSLNGEQLTPVAHRDVQLANRTVNKPFYPRVEGAFNKVIRYGNKPSNYWWEVTDKNGTKYFYGATATGYDKSAVLRTNEASDNGNIAQWCLREVRDLNGNTTLYHYEKVAHPGVTGGSMGYQIYVKKITYTGHKGSEGPYSVEFNRERELTPAVIRPDISIMANLGFKQVIADRLKEVRVKFESSTVRSYKMKYKEGVFFKTLLDDISEFDSKDSLFTTHKFEYFNEVGSDANFKPLKGAEKWTPASDGVKGKFVLTDGKFTDKASALSGTKGKDKGLGVTVTAGLAAGSYVNKSLTVGGSFGYSQSEGEGLLSLIDIDGDGLADKVFMKDKKLFYRSNPSGITANTTFGKDWEIPLPASDNFYKEKSKSTTTGLEANAGIGSFSAFVGKGKTKTTSVTSVYFSEVNGDQLTDIVINGKVYFNRIDPATGRPSFTEDSNLTPSPIKGTGSVEGNIVEVDPKELEEAIIENPLHDVVRMWRAPYSGRIKITGAAKLLQSSDPERSTARADGVIVKIQHAKTEKWSSRIEANDYSAHTPANVNDFAIAKGDQIYFRVHSVDNGSYDSVQWSPVIEYLSPASNRQDTLKMKDANKKPLYKFSSADDYVLSAQQIVSPPFNGKVRIESDFTKPVTSDSLRAQILQINKDQDTTIVWEYKAAWNDKGVQSVKRDVTIDTTQYLTFRVSTSTNIDWSSLKWEPRLYYIASNDNRYKVVINTAGAPDPLIEFHPVPEYTIFADVRKIAKPYIVGDNTSSITITPQLTFKDSFAKGKIIFSVKKPNQILKKDTLYVVNGAVTADAITVTTKKGDSLYIEYHVPDFRLGNAIVTSSAVVTGGAIVKTGLYTVFNAEMEYDVIFGPLYRHWGQFAYNGNLPRGNNPIDEKLLKLSDGIKKAPKKDEIKNPDELETRNAYSPASDNFILMTPRGKERVWGGYDLYTFVSATVISSSRMGEKDLSSANAVPGNGARAINKVSKSESKSVSAGAGAGIVSGSYNRTKNAWSRLISDYMDMNGDRYPDIVTEKKIQYSTANGGMEPESRSHGQGVNHETITNSEGYSISGSFVVSKTEGSASNARNTRTSVGNARVNAGLGVNAGTGDNRTAFTWMDINGDGLPDKVFEGGQVSLNLGYSFLPKEQWGYADIQKGESTSEGGGASINIGTGSQSASFAAGVGLALSENFITTMLQDINGDGLTDAISKAAGGVKVKLNTGSGFSSTVLNWNNTPELNKSSTASQSANVSFTGCFPIWVVRICINPSVNAGNSVSRDLNRLSDMDGDGYPDYVTSSDDDGDLKVSRSNIGRTNLLKGVARPMGATFSMSYKRLGNTYELPNSLWVLDSVKVFDGVKGDGIDNMLTTFTYEGGFHDRNEREFYGFSKVITTTHDTEKQAKPVYTRLIQNFQNTNYYEKGLLLSEVLTDGAGNKFVIKENIYQLKNIFKEENLTAAETASDSGNAFPALIETRQMFFEGQSEAGKTTSMRYVYDVKGNVTNYTDFGDAGAEDDISASIAYHTLADKYVIGTPQQITVTGGGKTYRKRESVIDPNTGDIKQIKQFLSDSEFSVHDLEYDEYGNLKKITRPKNAKNQRLSFDYTYDDVVHTYTTKVGNSYGYTSEAIYDFRFGQVLSSKDLNGNEITYQLDKLGRVVKITGPYEKGGNGYTIRFKYHPEAAIPYALTEHFDPSDPKNPLKTAIFVDGLGRVLQTKKDVAIYHGDGKADVEMMAVSGRVKFDAFGRAVSALYPVTAPATTPGEFITKEDTEKPTLTTYDVLNRALTITLPDLAVTATSYSFESDREGKKQFSTKTTDANGKQTEQFTDVKGRVTSVKNYTSDKPVWTSFKYNPMSEQIEATNDLGHTTFSQYDNFGRRISRKHPDAGTTTYLYDLAGNLRELVTANLQKEGKAILYAYDFERLTDITYPENTENNVKYTYGAAGASDNRAGRVVLQEDATGAQEFFYGPLGEVVKNIRTIVIPQHDEQTHITEWKYDTWNRLTSMIYADGEEVTYNYNAGGLLRSMTGKKKGATYNYVNQLGYDKFEQRLFLAYGNGTKTTYSYENDRRRLKNMTAQTTAKRLFMDNTYTYDKVNNILGLKNNAPIPSPNLMGGSSDYSYEYDDLYRLTEAQGSYKGANDAHTYTLSMEYNTVGGITHKVQNHERKGNVQKKTSYDLSYAYSSSEQPNAPTHIGEQTYTYDANGNQTGWTSDVSGQRRKILWDEENRIRSIYDNGSQHHYVYDAAGERVLKGKSTGQRIFVNGEWKAGSGQMGNYTVYVNPYLVLRSGGYTKHYYIEGQRIVSKLGGGIDNNGKGPLKAGGSKVDYVGKSQRVFDGIVKNLKFLGADGQILTAGKSGKIPPGQLNGTGGNVTEAFRYFYHPDHLGSTSYVTDASGEVFQHLEYFAFGETFVEEHSNTDRTPYLFNRKELDDETGLYYYGARYYDAKTSIWQSVDPLAEKYPGWNPYNYCGDNPINFVDPDGREVIPTLSINYGLVARTIPNIHFLGQTTIARLTPIKRADGKYDVKAEITISMNNRFTGGPSNRYNPNTSFNKENPGLHEQVMSHEESHVSQFKDVLQQDGYSYNVNGKTVSGKLDKVFTEFLKSIDKEVKDLNTKGFKDKAEADKTQGKITDKVNKFYKSIYEQIDKKMTDTFGNVEQDAVKKTLINLKSQGRPTNYQEGRTPIMEDGKKVPEN